MLRLPKTAPYLPPLALTLFVTATLADAQQPTEQASQPSRQRQQGSLRGNDIPEYYLARMFLDSVNAAANRSSLELHQLLSPYGISDKSSLRESLVKEAALIAETLAGSRPYAPEDFPSAADFEEHNRQQVKETARLVGESWGRFLLVVQASGRQPEGLVEAIRYHYGQGLAVLYSGRDDEDAERAMESIFLTHAVFQKTKSQELND
jgi:hypothetical protein